MLFQGDTWCHAPQDKDKLIFRFLSFTGMEACHLFWDSFTSILLHPSSLAATETEVSDPQGLAKCGPIACLPCAPPLGWVCHHQSGGFVAKAHNGLRHNNKYSKSLSAMLTGKHTMDEWGESSRDPTPSLWSIHSRKNLCSFPGFLMDDIPNNSYHIIYPSQLQSFPRFGPLSILSQCLAQLQHVKVPRTQRRGGIKLGELNRPCMW